MTLKVGTIRKWSIHIGSLKFKISREIKKKMIISRSGQHVAQKAFSKHKGIRTGLFFLERDLVVYILNLVKVFAGI